MATVAWKDTTIRRDRRTSEPAFSSTCFHSTPSSSSCRQMAFVIVYGSPRLSCSSASTYVMSPRQSQPSASDVVMKPRPHSPMSKAVRRWWSSAGSRYGTTISANDSRCAMGRTCSPSR